MDHYCYGYLKLAPQKQKRMGGPGDFDSWAHLKSNFFNDS